MIVIGDIAGQFKTLEALLKQVPKDCPIVSLGDMVDRGPDSKKVLNFFKNHKALMGNHEHLMIDAYEYSCNLHKLGATIYNWRQVAKDNKLKAYYQVGLWIETNGGENTIESYAPGLLKQAHGKILNLDEVIFNLINIIPKEDIDWLKSLPLYIETDDFFLSHAPKKAKKTPNEVSDMGEGFWLHGTRTSEMSLIWNRSDPSGYLNKMQIFGHNAYPNVRAYSEQYKNGIDLSKALVRNLTVKDFYALGIDTSANKTLTAIHLPSMTIYQQKYLD